MSAVISIFVSLPITVSVLAALFSQRVISPGLEGTVIVTTVSLYFAAFGAMQTYEGRRISQQMQDASEAKERERKYALARFEIPHVVYSLKMLRLEMGKTMKILNRHSVDGVAQTEEGAKHIRRRAMMHIESIRSLSSTFFGIELSKHHKLLDGVLVNLDEIVFLSQDGKVSMPKFKESIYMVSHAIETISDEFQEIL